MPPKIKISKQDIITSAVNMVRQKGADALNARALAAYIGCSTQPIFSNFSSMEELKEQVVLAATTVYLTYIQREIDSQQYPEYKASGMAYIRFAKDEKELFKLLFMRDRSDEIIGHSEELAEDSIYYIHKNIGLSYEDASIFHLEMWVYVHGIATILATSYLPLEWEIISDMLTDAFVGLKKRYLSKEET